MTVTAGPAGWVWGRYSRLGLSVCLVTLLLDQASKWWLLEGFDLPARGRVALTPFFDLVYVKNIGISYSLLGQGTYTGQLALAAFGALATCALWIWLARGVTNTLMAVSLGLEDPDQLKTRGQDGHAELLADLADKGVQVALARLPFATRQVVGVPALRTGAEDRAVLDPDPGNLVDHRCRC